MKLFSSCTKTVQIFCSSFEDNSLLQGITDVIVVKDKNGQYRSTKFFVCMGVQSTTQPIQMYVNKKLINQLKFTINKYGYLSPTTLTSQQIQLLDLKYGKNTVQYKLQQHIVSGQIYLYIDLDKIVVSDVDGTLTKNDIGGLVNNYMGNNYLHDGYHQLINSMYDHGYKIVWLTMRSLPLYTFSKQYIRQHVKVQGPLLMQPQQFLAAFKKQLLKQTSNIKSNIMRDLKSAFPPSINPFVGGLGNRDNDAIAYRSAGIDMEHIYIVDTKSQVHKLDNKKHDLTYQEIVKQIKQYFPQYYPPKVGYF